MLWVPESHWKLFLRSWTLAFVKLSMNALWKIITKMPLTAKTSKKGAAINLVLLLLPLEVEIATENTLRAFPHLVRATHPSARLTATALCCGGNGCSENQPPASERINHSPARAGSLCQHSCTEQWAAGEILQLVYAEYRTPRPWTFSLSRVSSCTPPPFLPSLPRAPERGSKIYIAVPLKCWLSMFTGIVYTEN